MSGTLYLSPPLPYEIGNGMIEAVNKKLSESDDCTLVDAPVSSILRVLKSSNLATMWLQATPEFEGWQEREECVQSLLIGDVEHEVETSSPFPVLFPLSLIC